VNDQETLFGPEPPPELKPWQQRAFDPAASKAARDEAILRVDANADEEWKIAATQALYRVALEQSTLISNDLWRYVSKPREPRALGPLMQRGVSQGWIVATPDFKPCPSVTRHAAPARIWRSRIWVGLRLASDLRKA